VHLGDSARTGRWRRGRSAGALRTLDLGADAGSAQLILPGDLGPADVDAIRAVVGRYVRVMRSLAAEHFDIALPELEIWMLELTEALTALAPRVVGPPVDPANVERLGGEVASKTMPLEDDWSRAAIATPGIGLVSDDVPTQAVARFTLLHELGHVLVERLGTMSGVRETGWHPTAHARRKAENAVRHGLDEWRVSTIASAALQGVITDGEGEELSIAHILGPRYRDGLGPILDWVYPGWPDMVTAHRQGEVPLGDVYAQIVGGTVDVFTTLSHCEAEAEVLQRGSPLREEYADHLGTRLYLGEPWGALLDCDAPLLAPLSEFAEAEGTYLAEVAPTIIAMWRRLGMTFTDGPGPDDLHIAVTEPLRDIAPPPSSDTSEPSTDGGGDT
jgi:hypothetical protein